MENRIKKTMSEVLDIKIDLINDDTSPDTIEVWDSLKQMNIIIALEEVFNIEFTDEEILEMHNYKLISYIIKEKINHA